MVKIKSFLSPSQISSGVIIPLLILVIIGGGYFLLRPNYREVRTHRQTLASKQALLQARQADLRGLKDLISDLDKKKTQLEPLEEALPDAPRLPELLANLDYLAKQGGVLISSINLTLPSEQTSDQKTSPVTGQAERLKTVLSATEGLGIIQIDMALRGQYSNLKNFLLNLEQNLRLTDIQALIINSASGKGAKGESNLQEYSLKIFTYYQKQQ